MTRIQMLELLENMYNQLHEDFPKEFYMEQSFEALDDAVGDLRAYSCRQDLDRNDN